MDAHHGASFKMQAFLDKCFTQSGVWPHMVFSGHVHNYQRFTRTIKGRQLPYIVAGAGGYWHLHGVNEPGSFITTPVKSSFKDVVFEKYAEDRHGFMQLTVDMQKREITGNYFTVPRIQESWKAAPVLFDSFVLDTDKKKLK